MDAFMNKLKVELIVIIKKGGTNYQLKKKWVIKNKQKGKKRKKKKNGQSVNYFTNLGTECHFSKIRCNKSSFLKKKKVLL